MNFGWVGYYMDFHSDTLYGVAGAIVSVSKPALSFVFNQGYLFFWLAVNIFIRRVSRAMEKDMLFFVIE